MEFVLYYIVLYYIVLYYIVLYYIVFLADHVLELTRRQVQGMVSILEFINQLSLRGKIKKNQNYDALLQILDDLKIVDPAEKVRSIIAEAAPDCRPTHSGKILRMWQTLADSLILGFSSVLILSQNYRFSSVL